MDNQYHCGPISIEISADIPEWNVRADAILRLYTPWTESQSPVRVHIQASDRDIPMGEGSFLHCMDMHVDINAAGLYATCRSGASGSWNTSLRRWYISMPKRYAVRLAGPDDIDDNLEDLLELVLTTEWRRAGWIPLHAGAVVKDGRCAILTAPSRGGKTTSTVAMLHHGWKTLGDDKLLIGLCPEQQVELYSLQSLFNIDPQTNKWFPEVGDLTRLPLDSVWTPKRRLPIEHIWHERFQAHARPTHLVQIVRYPYARDARVEALDASQVLSALLHQTVVPKDRSVARQVLASVAALAKQVRGLRLELGLDAYADPRISRSDGANVRVKDLPSVSVVIPVLNGADTIGSTLAGLLNQVEPPCVTEIIVVDNGSTDETPAVVGNFPVKLLCESKRGPSAARNRGLNSARGEVVAYLDADTLPTRHWLGEIVSPFVDPAVLLVAGRIIGYRPETAAAKFFSRFYLDREQEDAHAVSFPFAPSGNMAVRRTAALAIGGWDEEFRVAQDMDFSYRLVTEFNTTIHYQRRALVLLRTRTSIAELNRQAFKYGQGRAKLWMRYPSVAGWNALRALGILCRLAVIGIWPLVASMARIVGRASQEDVIFAKYYRSWNWWSWRGFANMLLTKEWRLD